jgi:indole-3-glycerol phosphate synthase
VSRTVLEDILASTRAETERRKRELPLEQLRERGEALGAAAPERVRQGGQVRQNGHFHTALKRPGITVIAEFKRRSPSAGPLRERPDLAEMLTAYARGGAGALSILTEGPSFGGSLEDLRLARSVCELPILRKDFILDPYQLHEARVAGADAVLLIVAALEQPLLGSLHEAARALGLDVLVEVHDRRELERALAIGARLIGVNNRDLRDFSVDVQRTSRLMSEIPSGVTVVSESGIASAEQLHLLHEQGVQAVLVGESLMRARDPAATLRALQSFRDTEAGL